MKEKSLSVIIVPHGRTNTRTLTFSRKSIKGLTAAVSISLALVLVFLVDYLSMGLMRVQYRKLLKETQEQKARLVEYEKSFDSLRDTISSFEVYAKKLNIMAGLKSPDVLTAPLGVGGGPATETYDLSGPEQVIASGPQVLSPTVLDNLSQKAASVDRNLGSLLGYFESELTRLSSTPSIMPVNGWLSSRFGPRKDPFTGRMQMHSGIDIATNIGNPIVATADGIIITAASDRFLGKHVIISHGFGFNTLYGHLNGFAVKAGQKVKRGDVIGYVGQTGKALGPHVHYEVRINGKSVDPMQYILEE